MEIGDEVIVLADNCLEITQGACGTIVAHLETKRYYFIKCIDKQNNEIVYPFKREEIELLDKS